MNSSRWGGGVRGSVNFHTDKPYKPRTGVIPPPRSATGLNGLLLISAPVLVLWAENHIACLCPITEE